MRSKMSWRAISTLATSLLMLAPQARAQTGGVARSVITAPVDETRLARLPGNTRPEANARNDRGRVSDSLPLEHMQLLLRRPAEREVALRHYLDQLHDRTSPYFHRWLSASEVGRQFGLSGEDIATVSGWLQQHGFVVNAVLPNAMVIDFSGTAGNVRAAFRSEIHALEVDGVRHIANMSDPQIPAALAPAVVGIVSLHDFRPHPMNRMRTRQYTTSSGGTLVAPADLATIYNLNPLFAQGYAGQSQTIVVIEDTDVYSTDDWTTFRSTFGLSGYSSGSFIQEHPAPASGRSNCADPGVLANDAQFEAILDAEWSSAAAPGAAIELASCADTTTFGGLIALENLLQGSSPPAIISISYGECEAGNGATANAAYSSAYQQAVAEGVSVFVASGDEGAAGCDPNSKVATHGIGVNGFASTVYNVAVGGTDFGDTYAGTTGRYWSSTNSASYGSALSYVPEIPWNDSCAGALLSGYEGYATPYGSSGFCNSSTGQSFLTTTAGSGGPSGCASGSPSTAGVVSGTCAGTSKPSWQSRVPGIPADGVRDLPDVALFAANGLWGHYYVVCWSDTAQTGGEPCTGAPSGWSGGGGTSFAAPILAGIQALVNQSTGARQGNPDYVYYTLAASQSSSGLSCNSTSSSAVASGCVFYDVTQGDMDVDCQGSHNCYLPSGTDGVLSTSDSSYSNAYGATTGWDFATGIGSINASNLVKYWTSADLSLSGGGNVTTGDQLSYTFTVGNQGPQSAGGVVVSTVVPSGVTLVNGSSSSGCTQSGQTVSCSVGALAVGSTASLTIILQPNTSPQTFNLTFTASSNIADLNPSDGSDTIALYWSGSAGDVPLPLWANVALGLLLLILATRRLPLRPNA
jgi:uncharacterized repeat protein (TIGR01451 family)